MPPTAATTFVITRGHNSGKNGHRKKSLLYDHLHILLDYLCKFERNPPDSLEEVDATRLVGHTDGRTYELVQLYMSPTSWGHKN
jgi:hypothetical protein